MTSLNAPALFQYTLNTVGHLKNRAQTSVIYRNLVGDPFFFVYAREKEGKDMIDLSIDLPRVVKKNLVARLLVLFLAMLLFCSAIFARL